jgi:hypothetical protein
LFKAFSDRANVLASWIRQFRRREHSHGPYINAISIRDFIGKPLLTMVLVDGFESAGKRSRNGDAVMYPQKWCLDRAIEQSLFLIKVNDNLMTAVISEK